MWCTILFVVSCFAIIISEKTSEDLHELQNKINKDVKTVRKDDNVSTVIFNDIAYEIYLFDPKKETEYPKEDLISLKAMKFYSCVNCRMAQWIIKNILEYSSILRHFYRIIMFNKLPYENKFYKKFGELQELTISTTNILNVLFEVLELYSYSSQLDTSLLNSVLSLHLNIYFSVGIL